MNNLLSYNKFKEYCRMVESIDSVDETNIVNEGFMKKLAQKRVNKILNEEIELSRMIEEKIRTSMEEIEKLCENLKLKKDGSDFKKRIEEVINDINKQSFDVLSLLGDSTIDFAGFKKGAVMANIMNVQVLLSPFKNGMMLNRAYKYFIGLIKQALRKDLIMLLINFDQFQNLILKTSLEAENESNRFREYIETFNKIETMVDSALSETFGKRNERALSKFHNILKMKKEAYERMERNNPAYRIFSEMDTYKLTADMLKNYSSEDNSKKLEALKSSINKIASGDKDGKLSIYGDVLINLAEDKAMSTTLGIHANFLKISEVFKLSNQKKLAEAMKIAEEEYQLEIKNNETKMKKKLSDEFDAKLMKFIDVEGKKISKGITDVDDYIKITGESKCPGDIRMLNKEIFRRWYMKNKDSFGHDELKVILPITNKYDKDYEHSFISYLNVLCKYFDKFVIEDDKKSEWLLSIDECKDDVIKEKFIKKFYNTSLSSIRPSDVKEAKNALRIISDEIVDFDYDALYEKLKDKDCMPGGSGVKVSSKIIKEWLKSVDYMIKYKDNGYSTPKDDKESGEKK